MACSLEQDRQVQERCEEKLSAGVCCFGGAVHGRTAGCLVAPSRSAGTDTGQHTSATDRHSG